MNHRLLFAATLASTILLSSAGEVRAQEPPKPAPATPPAAAEKKDAAAAKPDEKKPEEKKEQKPKNIDETVKDFQKIEGLFTFYRQKKDNKDTLYMEVPEEKLGKMFLLQATASTGLGGTSVGIFQGAPLDDIPVEMKVVDDSRVLFLRPNLDARAPRDKAMRYSLEKGTPPVILFSAEIKARQPERKAVLIDAGAFFKSDVADLGAALTPPPMLAGRASGMAMDPTFTYIDSLKVFPENFVVRSVYKLNRTGPPSGPKAVPFAVSYNFSALPETSYRPRIADARVGYFLTSYNDRSENAKYDTNVNFIQRWNLEKADPSAPLSPPKKAITFWIDRSVPAKYRPAVRDGLLMYNKAFEKVGIKDAIVVKEVPDDADWDIADVRYNIIRWTDGYGFAIALFRAHPVTGEILNAAINMDGNFVTGGVLDWDITVDGRAAARRFADRALRRPERAAAAGLAYEPHDHAAEVALPWLAARTGSDPRFCTHQRDAALNFRFGQTALEMLSATSSAAAGVMDRERFVNQYVSEVVAHEMGHCLGLRHNFIASTQFTPAQLKDPNVVGRSGIGSTVMDYNPFNIFALRQRNVDFYSQTVGSYDFFAIDYGYRFTDARTPEAELPALRKLASQTSKPGLTYMSDGTADNYDPRISRFDLGADPLAYAERTMSVSRYLMRTLPERKPKNGESYYEYTRSFSNLLSSYFGGTLSLTRYLGGAHLSESRKGDPGGKLPLTPIAAADQKRALNLLNQYVFSPGAYSFPKKNLMLLGANPNTPNFEPTATQRLFPIYDTFAAFQQIALDEVFWSPNLTRMANLEYKAEKPGDTLSLASLFRSVRGAVWSELSTGAEITPLRRDLQRYHLDLLIGMVKGPRPDLPRDAVTLAWEQLRAVRASAAAATPTAKGEYGKPHLAEVTLRIDRVLNAPTLVN